VSLKEAGSRRMFTEMRSRTLLREFLMNLHTHFPHSGGLPLACGWPHETPWRPLRSATEKGETIRGWKEILHTAQDGLCMHSGRYRRST